MPQMYKVNLKDDALFQAPPAHRHGVAGTSSATDAVDLWWTLSDEVPDDRLQDYQELLSSEEHERALRFRFDRERKLFLIARALLRSTLSRYVGIHPAQWRFGTERHGRPIILNQSGLALSFSVTHTEGLVAVAISRHRMLGADGECSLDRKAPLEIMEHVLTPAEAAELESLPEVERSIRFFEYWVLKESYVKAIGTGLSFPLRECRFDLQHAASISLVSAAGHRHVNADWYFWLLRIAGRFVLSICAQQREQSDLRLSLTRTVPLLGDQPARCEVLRRTALAACRT